MAETLVDTARRGYLEEKPVTEIWPLVTFRASLFFDQQKYVSPIRGNVSAGLSLSSATNPRFSGTGVFSDGIMRALTYCHGLVIEDPLCHAAELHLGSTTEMHKLST
ncbi:MAG: hypothetical protein FWF91_04565 [Coriobacteriia bacterium]|nr:hypothetical protein [Coriobacteriia bacterium]